MIKTPLFILSVFLAFVVFLRSTIQEPLSAHIDNRQAHQNRLSAWYTAFFDNSVKIPIDSKRWYQLNNTANGLEGLFDNITDIKVLTGYGKVLLNYDAYYPLEEGEEMTIESIRFYDGDGSNINTPMTLSIINDQWQRIPIATFTGDRYNQWVGPFPGKPSIFSLEKPIKGARYLVLNTSGAYPNELELYGTYKAGAPATLAPKKPVVFRQQVGVNAFEWDFMDPLNHAKLDEARVKAVKNFTAIRHYIDWEKLEYKEGDYTFNPTISGRWNYDAIYERCKQEGIEVLACLKTIPIWMQNTYPSNLQDSENVPIRYGMDLGDPTSYKEQAKVAFQYAARYGHNKSLSPAFVSVFSAENPAPNWYNSNVVKIGLGLINYMECDNERDKWWKGRKAYQTAREYAANLSAFYDGHKNTLGPGVGVKNADPNMQVVIGGLAAPTTDYVRGMIDWCREFRGYKANGQVDLCWDVINQHLYANDARLSQGGNPTRGAAPEVSGVGNYAEAFVKLARQYSYGMPVWITEAGYDVNPGSTNKAISIGNKSVLQVQADWTLRTALLYARVGVNRLFLYQLYDDDITSTVKFQSMGLINRDQSRKPAADYLYQANKLLGNYIYQETISRDPLVDRYELNDQSAYVLLIGDEKGRTADFILDVGDMGTTRVYKPKIGSDSMEVVRVNPSMGKLKLMVTETPLFVITSKEPPPNTSLQQIQIYPNPSTDYIHLSLTSEHTTDINVNVYDISGRLQQHVCFLKPDAHLSAQVNISSLPPGMYMFEIQQGSDRIIRKILRTR